jgi:hypothetical protein
MQQLTAYDALPAEDKKKQLAEMQKLFRDLRPPESCKNLTKILSEAFRLMTPCRRCGGEGTIKCNACEDGQASFVCNACQGWGGRDKNPCRYCKGAGGNCDRCGGKRWMFDRPCPACKERGRWKDACTKCQGSGKQDCPQCKEPWVEPKLENLVSSSPCWICGRSGFTFDRVLLPCASCHGLGRVMAEPVKSDKAR